MTIKRIVSLIMAALMVFSVFTMTAVAAVEPASTTSDCQHEGTNYQYNGRMYEMDGSQHKIIDVYIGKCKHCGGELVRHQDVGSESHSYVQQYPYISQYHSGSYHYYTYLHRCKCGASYTRDEPEYCGNPCGGIHFSIPDENI